MDSENFEHTEDNILIIKGRFKAISLNIFGQFFIIFNNSKKFDTYNSVVSTYSDLYELEPNSEWTTYEEYIANVKWKGNFNANMTTSMIDQFKKFSEEMNSVSLLYDNAYDYDYNALDATLYDLVNRIIHDKSLLLETSIQEVTPVEFSEAKEKLNNKANEAFEEKKDSHSSYSLEEGSIILSIKSILSPVKGKPVYEIKIGDKIMVNLIPNSDKSNYFIDLLELRDGSFIKPIAGEVIDIKAGSGKGDPTEILTMIAPKLYGKFIEDEKQVKLKMYNPETDGPLIKKKVESAKNQPLESDSRVSDSSPIFSKGTLIMLILFLLILSLFVGLIIFSLS